MGFWWVYVEGLGFKGSGFRGLRLVEFLEFFLPEGRKPVGVGP